MGVKAYGSSGGDFTPAPEGTHNAVCVDVIDLGLIERTYEGKTTNDPMVRIVWQLEEEDEDGRRFTVGARYKLSLHEKANLRKMLDTWRGVAFSKDDLKDGWDLDNLIGAPALVTVQHNEREGKVYANVQAVTRLPKSMLRLEADGYTRKQDREAEDRSVQSPPSPGPNVDRAAKRHGMTAPPPPRAVEPVDDDLPF